MYFLLNINLEILIKINKSMDMLCVIYSNKNKSTTSSKYLFFLIP